SEEQRIKQKQEEIKSKDIIIQNPAVAPKLDSQVTQPSARPLPSPPGFVEGTRYVALFDYTARTADDLTFNTGDVLEVLDSSTGEWWIARAVTGISANTKGYIPANYVAPVESIDAEP
uniref:SH3 domain-containing protein n=1 Tax=Cyprinodon variegatus TaxID=28743 RepID=A0A3Q2GDJ2_CYPVA